jgi:hypothetical protein
MILLLHMQFQPTPLFPEIEAKTLTGNKIVFPQAAYGKKVLYVVAFHRGAQSQADAWYNFYKELFQPKGYVFYEIPMISNMWSWMSGMIDNGMRSGVPAFKHNNVATYYGPLKKYYEFFEVKDKDLVYVFSVDEKGHIVAKTHGFPTKSAIELLK